MKVHLGLRRGAWWSLLALLALQLILPGCLDDLCKLRLYLYRDVQQKSPPPADMALLITDPAILMVLVPEARGKISPGLPWAPEQPNYASDFYRLSVDGLDDRPVYQGRCMNVTPTYVCEVHPGSRRVMTGLMLMGPWGRENFKDLVPLTLKPGEVYFLYPKVQGASQRRFLIKAERLPASYNEALRAKLMDWLHQHTTGRTLED
jgi:hypothetical protein